MTIKNQQTTFESPRHTKIPKDVLDDYRSIQSDYKKAVDEYNIIMRNRHETSKQR